MAGRRPRKAHDRAAVMAAVCERVSKGALVKDACKELGVDVTTVWRWTEDDDELRKAYARAREDQANSLAEEAMRIADEECKTSDEVARNRLRVDTRKWFVSKIAPRTYGDRTQHEVTGAAGGPLTIRVVHE